MTHPGADSAGGTRTDPVTGRAARVRQGLSIMLVVALTALTVVTLPLIATTSPAYRDPGALAYVLVGLAAAVTLLRHRWPVTACLATTAVVAAYLVLALPYGPIFGFIVLTVYALARHRPLRVSAPTAGVCLLLELAHVPISDASLSGGIAVLPALAWISIPFTIGASLRAVATARMRERSAADQRLVDTERLHVSQEVHDVVGHGLAAIQMQADITLHVHAGDPERMEDALRTISTASQDALDELRATLSSIRNESGEADRTPTPGLARARVLHEHIEAAGVHVELSVEGEVRPLHPAADVAAYRVLQESLTNVVKHSTHRSATVLIRHNTDAVMLQVTNQAPVGEPIEGTGITGMRRRVLQVGGTFHAGPGPRSDTFQVRASIPRRDAR